MITYPLSLPTSPSPASISFTPQFAVGESISPFSYQAEYFDWLGQQLMVQITLPPMSREQAEEWLAWGLALNGVLGSFVMGDMTNSKSRGTMAGTPVVNGAGQQRGNVLNSRGWTALSPICKKGDLIQLGSRLYRNLSDVTAAADGTADLDVFPRLRDTLTDGQQIITNNPTGLWRLSKPFPWDIKPFVYSVNFTAKEAL